MVISKFVVEVEAMDKSAVETSRFGTIEFETDKIITFVEDILGFPDSKEFILIPHGDDSSLKWLQCLSIPELAFAVLDPWLLFDDYQPHINELDLESLDIRNASDDDLVVLIFLTIHTDRHEMTANLKAPIILNTKLNKAKQVVLIDDKYSIKEPISHDK